MASLTNTVGQVWTRMRKEKEIRTWAGKNHCHLAGTTYGAVFHLPRKWNEDIMDFRAWDVAPKVYLKLIFEMREMASCSLSNDARGGWYSIPRKIPKWLKQQTWDRKASLLCRSEGIPTKTELLETIFEKKSCIYLLNLWACTQKGSLDWIELF